MDVGGSKDQYVWNLIMYRNGKFGSLYGSMLPKIHMISKRASNKRCLKLNFVQKSPQGICLSEVELGCSKDQYIWHLLTYRNGKLGSLYGLTMPKVRISRKAWNKSCLELNFLQKSPRAHLSIYPRSGARASKINMRSGSRGL